MWNRGSEMTEEEIAGKVDGRRKIIKAKLLHMNNENDAKTNDLC